MNEDLKEAQRLLNISEVHTREALLKIHADENFMSISKIKKILQSYRSMVKIEEIAISAEDGSNKRYHYIFTYALGIRLIREEDKDNESSESLVVIEAEFDACYLSKHEVTKDQLDAFSQNNVGYHIWPYWREFVQSSCSRAGLSPIRVPFYKMNDEKVKCIERGEA
ncbi:hypothetical protein [Erwinia sp. Leaf53]|uniref:hypothetical protein n=1 Tax=Erwinia sp. Leaf53 TaxID=1736225 RepID=UPI0006FB681D|nr:hypothetical protein [Erwinia sp. Leaf53]KQN53180.1 hypothetical protein ASF13_16410 [Erwinia sp. Leaf53]